MYSRMADKGVKMKITHYLKDGTVLEDITGYVVRYADCPDVYHLLADIERSTNGEKSDHHHKVDSGDGKIA